MSFLKKIGAVVVGTASAATWVGAQAVKEGFEAFSDKLGKNGSCTGSNGQTYTGNDYKNAAKKIDEFTKKENGIIDKGFKKMKDLWNDD